MKKKYALYAPTVTLICFLLETALYFIAKPLSEVQVLTSGFNMHIFISGILNSVVVTVIWIFVSFVGYKIVLKNDSKGIAKKSAAIIFIPFAMNRLVCKFITLITAFITDETVSYIALRISGLVIGSVISYIAVQKFMKMAVFNDYVLNPPQEVLPLQNSKPLSANAWFAPVAVLVYSITNAVVSSVCMSIYGAAAAVRIVNTYII
ncbi:MAG: hypothetical protein ACLUFN_03925 [Eubacterium sp.]